MTSPPTDPLLLTVDAGTTRRPRLRCLLVCEWLVLAAPDLGMAPRTLATAVTCPSCRDECTYLRHTGVTPARSIITGPGHRASPGTPRFTTCCGPEASGTLPGHMPIVCNVSSAIYAVSIGGSYSTAAAFQTNGPHEATVGVIVPICQA